MPNLHVCSLARLPETVAATGASHVVTLINRGTLVERPAAIAPERHLFISMSDIVEPLRRAHHSRQRACGNAARLRAAVGSRKPAGLPLFCRDQPLHRRGLHHRLRARARAGRGRHCRGFAPGLPDRHAQFPARGPGGRPSGSGRPHGRGGSRDRPGRRGLRGRAVHPPVVRRAPG